METKERIAALSDDAPATAVIAAWAGMKVTEYPEDTGKFIFHRPGLEAMWDVPNPRRASDERTLRRWLREGGESIWEPFQLYSGSFITHIGRSTGEADSPEAAFKAAIEQFAGELRQEASPS